METSNNDDGECCVICLSTVSERAVASCGHASFDFLCFVSWLQERSSCPLCKAEVKTVTYQHKSPTDYKTYHVRPTPTTGPMASTGATGAIRNLHPRYGFAGRLRTPRRSYERPSPNLALLRRRHVYRERLYSLHVGSNRVSQYRNWDPEMVRKSTGLQSRARTWIRRELRVFSFLNSDPSDTPADAATTSSNAEFLLTYILSILRTVDIKASDGHAENLLADFLGRDNAKLFLHELNAWMRSPFTKLDDWDRNVQYSERLPSEFDNEGRPVISDKEGRSPLRRRSRSPDAQGRRAWRDRQ